MNGGPRKSCPGFHREFGYNDHAVPRPAARTIPDKTPAIDKGFEAGLQGPAWRRGLQRVVNLLGGHSIGVLLHSLLDSLQILFRISFGHSDIPACA